MVNKIDSNFTGLRYAEESDIGVLPGSPVWNQLEPNSYNDFGATITTQARTPIEAGRQRKKGVVTDLDAVGGFSSDFTQTNFYDLMQGFFFADWRKKLETTASAAAAASDDWTVDDETGFLSGHLVYVKGFSNTANNGLHVLNGSSANALSTGDSLVDETGTATVKCVGFQFGSGILSVNQVSASQTEFNIASLVAASKVLTITDIDDLADETVTVGSTVYTFKTALSTGPTVANQVLIGANIAAAVTNLTAAINGSAGVGTTYSVGTAANADVTAVANTGSGTVTVTAKVPGAIGNSIALAETLTDGSWASGATALSGGTGVGWVELGIIPGEWVFIGGDTGGSSGNRFTTAGNNGWVRALTVEHAKLTVDKTQGTKADEVGGTLTVQVFFGDVIKNESDPDLIVRRSYQLERSLVSAGYEYVKGCVANTLNFQVQTSNKITCELGFIATDAEQLDENSRKAGTFPTLVASDAFNTSSDFGRLRLSSKDALSTPLFAFMSELTLSINNNVTPNKAVSVLGAFDLTAGDFVVEGNLNAYFADIQAVAAVRNNTDVTIDFSVVKNNAGWLFDLPLISLGDGRLQVEKDQPIKIPLSMAAAADQTFNHTLLAGCFSYLPDAAE